MGVCHWPEQRSGKDRESQRQSSSSELNCIHRNLLIRVTQQTVLNNSRIVFRIRWNSALELRSEEGEWVLQLADENLNHLIQMV